MLEANTQQDHEDNAEEKAKRKRKPPKEEDPPFVPPAYDPVDTSDAPEIAEAEDDLETKIVEEEIDLRARIAIDPAALEEEFVTCSGHIAYAAGRHARAVSAHLTAKARAKRLRALLYADARNWLVSQGIRKPTVSDIDARVETDPRYLSAQAAEDNAEAFEILTKGNLTALVVKKDMLVQLGANYRAEGERDPYIRSDRIAGRMARGAPRLGANLDDPDDG